MPERGNAHKISAVLSTIENPSFVSVHGTGMIGNILMQQDYYHQKYKS